MIVRKAEERKAQNLDEATQLSSLVGSIFSSNESATSFLANHSSEYPSDSILGRGA